MEDYQELILNVLIFIYLSVKNNNMLSKGSDILAQKLGGGNQVWRNLFEHDIYLSKAEL